MILRGQDFIPHIKDRIEASSPFAWLIIVVIIQCAIAPRTALCQSPVRPIAKLDRQAEVELEVADRYGLDVYGYEARITSTRYLQRASLEESLAIGIREWTASASPASNRLSFELDPGCVARVDVHRSGYAPCRSYWLFPGYRYRLELHVGSNAVFQCTDAAGTRVSNASISVFIYDGPATGSTQRSLLEQTSSDANGLLVLNFLRNAQYSILAHSDTAGIGYSAFSVVNQFGHERTLTTGNLDLPFAPPVVSDVRVVDEAGNSVSSANVSARGGGLDVFTDISGVISRKADAFSVRAPPGMPVLLDITAPGFQSAKYRLGSKRGGELCTVVLRSDKMKTVTLSYPASQENQRVLIPSIMDMISPWVELTGSSGAHVEFSVPEAYTIMGLVISKTTNRITGFLREFDNNRKAVIVPSGTMQVALDVDGAPPGGCITRLRYVDDARALCPQNLLALIERTCVASPSGVLLAQDLLPGVYSLDPHIHGTVYSDAVQNVRVGPGRDDTTNVTIRRGLSISGVVIDSDTGRPIESGHIIVTMPDSRYHFPFVQVRAGGRFVISGIPPGYETNLTYYDHPWFDPALICDLAGAAARTASVTLDESTLQKGWVNIRVPRLPATSTK